LTISIACAPATGYSQSPQIRVFFLSLLLWLANRNVYRPHCPTDFLSHIPPKKNLLVTY
jgi:hypothetical protein